jgi:hypothetical protein
MTIDYIYATIVQTAIGGSIAIVGGIIGSALTDPYVIKVKAKKRSRKKEGKSQKRLQDKIATFFYSTRSSTLY